MTIEINIEQIKADLIKLDSELSPSEVHGTLCGVLCGKSDINVHEWLSLTLLRETENASQAVMARDLLLEAITESFKSFFLATVTALSDNNLNFYPLLPEDESESVRLEAIAEWAQGFLMGLSLAGIKSFSEYPEEVTEFVEAMASISTAGDYDLAGDESDEEAIIEFIEFIRMGVLFLNEEMNPMRVPVDIPDSISDSLSSNKNVH
ncbi:MAG: YecA family protein [gamma proteobacterium symbiont of Bathyaustriella thionipta]|nr:YecA family protein [gamma proteobacterium symbiont of Bathyaustriella thionipta]MCU7948462.1 YecA family protein [gamma proteobacterium symbiont of Bathyaustriella thionipta]MCU7952458.1 YecA family protein [gamma proteobacterium symbiont of Bathyaustriella thionipta]MCU7955384.1 YecA family protein [gamma proteobacterium symbiont of Bathyaustriella thionipta]MCU7966212.1 YecA family protein [gamma proteobacterium symbiont of Bathyaustriella thionipta]